MCTDIQDIKDKLQDEYHEEMSEILGSYDFILPSDYRTKDENGNDYYSYTHQLPKSNVERYELLKRSTATFHFIQYKFDWMYSVLNINNIDLIKGELANLDKYWDHLTSLDAIEAAKLYTKAVKYFVSQLGFYNINTPAIPCSKDESTYYLILLHDKNYFSDNPITNEMFLYDVDATFMPEVAEVYGKYFLFHAYLQNKLRSLNSSIKEKYSTPLSNTKDIEKQCLINTWVNGKKEHYYKLIELLKEEDISTRHPFVELKGDQLVWIKQPQKGWQRYLAAFLQQCVTEHYINIKSYSIAERIAILKNTFNINELSRDAFEDDAPLKPIYYKPFEKMMLKIK